MIRVATRVVRTPIARGRLCDWDIKVMRPDEASEAGHAIDFACEIQAKERARR